MRGIRASSTRGARKPIATEGVPGTTTRYPADPGVSAKLGRCEFVSWECCMIAASRLSLRASATRASRSAPCTPGMLTGRSPSREIPDAHGLTPGRPCHRSRPWIIGPGFGRFPDAQLKWTVVVRRSRNDALPSSRLPAPPHGRIPRTCRSIGRRKLGIAGRENQRPGRISSCR